MSRDGNWTGWCRFFLTGVKAQAERNHDKASAILALYERMKRQVAGLTRSQFAIHALDWIFAKPIFKSSDFAASTGIPAPTAKCILGVLHAAEVLRNFVLGGGRQAAVLGFPALLDITEGREVF